MNRYLFLVPMLLALGACSNPESAITALCEQLDKCNGDSGERIIEECAEESLADYEDLISEGEECAEIAETFLKLAECVEALGDESECLDGAENFLYFPGCEDEADRLIQSSDENESCL